jgi:hypothetical protein
MVQQLERCLSEGFGEIEMAVQMRPTRGWTKRPRGALLQLGTESEFILCRIGGRLGSSGASRDGADVEIPP